LQERARCRSRSLEYFVLKKGREEKRNIDVTK
jgi:hypothetical protein